MITFTQVGTVLTCDETSVGNEYSDIDVAVTLSDSTFTEFDSINLYVSKPRTGAVFACVISNGMATIPHSAVSDTPDAYVSIGGFTIGGSQLTTNAIPLTVNKSNNPGGENADELDWKESMAEVLVAAAALSASFQESLASYLAETESMKEAAAAAAKEYAEEHGLSTVNVVDNLTSTSAESALSANQGRVLKEEIDSMEDSFADNALEAVQDGLTTGGNYVKVGSVMVCFGNFQISSINVTNESGSNYYGDGAIKASIEGNEVEDVFSTVGGFPACFSNVPSVTVFPSSTSSTMWTGHSVADAGGLKHLMIFRGVSKSDTSFTGRYIAVGRIDGARKVGAAVVSQGLPYLGDACGTEIIEAYNEFATDNQQETDSAWCSEFVSVCANRAGISTDVFPYFASAPKGCYKFSQIGCCYLRDTSTNTFVLTDVGSSSTSNFSDNLTFGTETYTPRLGDVIWTSNGVDFAYPTHSGLVVSVTENSDGTLSIYTLEGNLTDDNDNSVVQRRCRTLGGSLARDTNIYGIGRVDYPAEYNSSSASSSGSSDADADDGDDTTTTTTGTVVDGDTVTVTGLTATTSDDVIVVSGATATISDDVITVAT